MAIVGYPAYRTRTLILAQTMMTNRCLPPEILDYIVDILQDSPETLSQCCLTSKSWVLRTRKHLFAAVKFCTLGDIEAWKMTFPDPSNSPAHHTRSLSIYCLEVVTAADAAKGGWIRTFSRVVRLDVINGKDHDLRTYLPLFRDTLKSFSLSSFYIRYSQIIDLIYSFPLLEDLTLIGGSHDDGEPPTASLPSTPPALTGTLWLRLIWGLSPMVRRLLDLPGGLHFRELWLHSESTEDLLSAGKLVEGCSDTLEYLYVHHRPQGAVFSVPLVDR